MSNQLLPLDLGVIFFCFFRFKNHILLDKLNCVAAATTHVHQILLPSLNAPGNQFSARHRAIMHGGGGKKSSGSNDLVFVCEDSRAANTETVEVKQRQNRKW